MNGHHRTVLPLAGPSITFYGGVHEIRGNKFLVEHKGTRDSVPVNPQLHGVEPAIPRALKAPSSVFSFYKGLASNTLETLPWAAATNGIRVFIPKSASSSLPSE